MSTPTEVNNSIVDLSLDSQNKLQRLHPGAFGILIALQAGYITQTGITLQGMGALHDLQSSAEILREKQGA